MNHVNRMQLSTSKGFSTPYKSSKYILSLCMRAIEPYINFRLCKAGCTGDPIFEVIPERQAYNLSVVNLSQGRTIVRKVDQEII